MGKWTRCNSKSFDLVVTKTNQRGLDPQIPHGRQAPVPTVVVVILGGGPLVLASRQRGLKQEINVILIAMDSFRTSNVITS